jgi:ABC-2 type transport system permease protein
VSTITAVFGRELRSASRQPVAWFVAGAFLALHGIFFWQLMESYSHNSLNILAKTLDAQDFTLIDQVVRPLLVGDSFVLMLLLPALVMRQFSDEWRSGTSDLLLTYPLSESGIVLGKFLASAVITILILAAASLYPLVAGLWGPLEWPSFLLGQFGLLLYTMSVISISLCASASTDNPAIAFAMSFMGLLALIMAGQWGAQAAAPWDSVLRLLSFTGHVGYFGFGEFRLSSVIWLSGLTALFLFMATQILGRRRWTWSGRTSR